MKWVKINISYLLYKFLAAHQIVVNLEKKAFLIDFFGVTLLILVYTNVVY